MNFESIPFVVGDVVSVQGIKQGNGVIEKVYVQETPDKLCFVRVKFTDPNVFFEYVFDENDDSEKYFTKVGG